MQLAEDIRSRLPDTVRQIALPAILGGAGTGALSAYMSSKARPEGENPQQRRRRILRNALVGTLLGGTAGAAIPTGLRMLTQPYFGERQGFAPVERAADKVLSNPLPIGAAAAGGYWLRKNRMGERTRAFDAIRKLLPSNLTGAGGEFDSPERLHDYLAKGPNERSNVLQSMSGENGTLGDVFRHNELLSAAGHRGTSIKDLISHATDATAGTPGTDVAQRVRSEFGNHLTRQSILPDALKPYSLSGMAGRLAENESTLPLAEAYSNLLRPSARLPLGRMGWLPQLGIVGAGVLGAKKLQDSLTGN